MVVGILGHAARFAVYRLFPTAPGADHPGPDAARHLLRLLLRDRLHLRGRVLPEGRPRQRAGSVQRDDPRHRRTRGELDLPVAS